FQPAGEPGEALEGVGPAGRFRDRVEGLLLLRELSARGRPHVRVDQVALVEARRRRAVGAAAGGAGVVGPEARLQPLLLERDLVLERVGLDRLEVAGVRARGAGVGIARVDAEPDLAVQRA